MEAPVFPDFIAVHDDVLPATFCHDLIQAFEASDKRVPGSTGHGVDPTKKNSTDITLDLHAEWLPHLKKLLHYGDRPLKDYLSQLRFPLMGALSTALANPDTG